MLRGRTRRALVQLHLWLSLAVGLVFAVAAGTGALLTFRHDVAEWLNGGAIYAPTPGDVGLAAVERAARAARPDARLDILWFPRWNRPVYEAGYTAPDGAWVQLALDPGTGRVLEPLRPESGLISAVETVHVALLGGETGAWVVRVTTVLAVVILVTGAVLWWPGLLRLARGFRVRRGRGAYPLNFDLHQVTGILAFPALLLMCLSGVALVWPELANRAVHAVLLRPPSPLQDWTAVRSGPRPAGWTEADRPDLAALLRAAHAEVPGAGTFYVTWPHEPDEPIHIRLQTGIDPKPFGLTSRLAYDRYTGELLQVLDPRRQTGAERLVSEGVHRLHFGDWNVATRIVWALSCLAGVGLVVTGMVMWWLKRWGRRGGWAVRASRVRAPATRARTAGAVGRAAAERAGRGAG